MKWPIKFLNNPKPTTKLEITHRDSTKLTLREWQQDDGAVKTGGKVLSMGETQVMLQVLKNESPANYMLAPSATIEARACQQSRIEGYNLAINNFEAMGTLRRTVELGEPDFSDEKVDT